MKIYSVIAFTLLSFMLAGRVSAQEPKPKKEILVSISSGYYKNATQVIEGFLKQAQISDYFIDERIEKIERKNFQFKNKTVEQSVSLLSSFYNIEFKFADKKDFVTVIYKEKKQ